MSPLKANPSKMPVYVSVLVITLVKLGDSEEFDIPSVTQRVSCYLGLSESDESVSASCLYVGCAAGTLFIISLASCFGRRLFIVLSLYLMVAVTIVCAAVPNYSTLLVSRIAIGTSIGVNFVPLSIYMVEICPDKKFLTFAVTLTNLGHALGGGWTWIFTA